MRLAPGTMVAPQLRLVRLLGEGGMGSVWVADHLTLETQVAVKFVSSARALDPAALARFQREASVAAKIKSPHVVQTFDHGHMDDGTPFIVMELLAGESLADRLDRTRTLRLREASLFVSQVAEVLTRAHDLGIVHRDVKPANLFLIDSGYELFVKVLDFGIAKQIQLPDAGGMTSTGAIVGTPRFMSPEQLLDAKSADHKADLWALAVVAYQVLTGALPFQGETLGRLSLAIHRGTFTAPSRLRVALPAALDAWFTRALAIDPSARFGSARAMADAFLEVAATWTDDLEGAPTEPARPVAGRPSTLVAGGAAAGDDAVATPRAAPTDGPLTVSDAHSSVVPRAAVPAPAPSSPRTLAGAASTLDSGRSPAQPRARSRLAAGAVVAAIAMAGALGLALAQPDEAALPAPPAGAAPRAAGSPRPSPSSSAEASSSPEIEPATPRGEAGAPPPSASAAPTSAAPRASGARLLPPPRPRASASAAAPKADCAQPYTVDAEGILHVRPECL